jgi:transposase
MNLAELQQKLTAAARLQKLDDRVPYAFEKRIMAHIAERAMVSTRLLWARGLWRAAVSCVAVAVVCGTVALFAPDTHDGGDLSQDFENTLLASADVDDSPVP